VSAGLHGVVFACKILGLCVTQFTRGSGSSTRPCI
jgi:hypothetical protein